MPSLPTILRVVDAFRRLDHAYLRFYSPRYPGNYHTINELVSASALPRTTVLSVLDFLISIRAVSVHRGLVKKYRLEVWEFDVGSVHVEVELNRVIAYLRDDRKQ